MKNENFECLQMGLNDFDAPDMERIQQQQQKTASSWQVYYDESTDPPSPWWFNSCTGESTWESPIIAEDETKGANGGSGSANASGKSALYQRGERGGNLLLEGFSVKIYTRHSLHPNCYPLDPFVFRVSLFQS